MLDAKQRGHVLYLHGQETLSPIFGGTYRYDGTVTPDRFAMRYDSRYDSGHRRVAPLGGLGGATVKA